MPYYEEDDLNRFSEIGKHRPDLFEKFMAWYQACQDDGALSRREKALIGLAVAHALQCPYCIDAYSQACLESEPLVPSHRRADNYSGAKPFPGELSFNEYLRHRNRLCGPGHRLRVCRSRQ